MCKPIVHSFSRHSIFKYVGRPVLYLRLGIPRPLVVSGLVYSPLLLCPAPPLYLLVGHGMFDSSAKGLGASEAWRAGQAVVTRVCVLTPVFSVVIEAGVRHFCALWMK